MSDILTMPRPRLNRADLFALSVLILIGIAFFWRMVFTDLILPRGDVFTYFYPYWEYRNEAFRAGHIRLWNPFLFMGVPFLANSQAGVLYPPNWLLTPFDAPIAVELAIVSHAIWASIGTYLFARRSLHLSVMSSTLAAIVFAFGGYLTAQVEHVNQLQGLAWMPWLFFLWDESLTNTRSGVWLALAIAMQILAGHTQSAFISGIGLGLWALWHVIVLRRKDRRNIHYSSRIHGVLATSMPLTRLAIACLLAIGIAAAQLLPTAELTRVSNRSGGLVFREAVSFSLRPEIIGRAFIPGHAETSLFSEYIAYVGVASLILAMIGALLSKSSWKRVGLVILAGVGLFFALGKYNPAYWVLVLVAPGFNLFRAPARWLVLWAFGAACLSGAGLDALTGSSPIMPIKGTDDPRTRLGKRALVIAGCIALLLIALTPLASLSPDPLIGAVSPTLPEVALWLGVGLLAMFLAASLITTSTRALSFAPPALVALTTVELFIASQSLPLNHLSPPAAWYSQRPAISALLAGQEGSVVPARFLSLSDILFDPGDLREINAIFSAHLSDESLYDYIIAVKQKEILAPNLPIAWGVPSMDGFDGGILPTRDYTRFTGLFLPGDAVAVDGRLREYLHAVPPDQWLDLANVGYVITDKVYDLWHQGIYYDLQFSQQPPAVIFPSQPFEATAIGLIGHVDGIYDEPIATITISSESSTDSSYSVFVRDFSDPSSALGSFNIGSPEPIEYHALIALELPLTPNRIEIIPNPDSPAILSLRGVTLIDQRTGAFIPLSLSPDRRIIQSGDVKIYERVTLDRVYIVCDPAIVATEDLMWDRMQSGHIPVVMDATPADCNAASGNASITRYEPESVEVEVSEAAEGSYLILSDAWYPGWQATIDGIPTNVLKANGLFRAVRLTEGNHKVEFMYRSRTLEIGAGISILSLIVAVGGLIIRPKRTSSQP